MGISLGVVYLPLHAVNSIGDLILDDRMIDLIEEGGDIGLRIGPLRDSSLIVRKLATSRRLVLGTSDYFQRAGIPATPAELAGHTAVVHTRDRDGSDAWTFRQIAPDQQVSEIPITLSGPLRVSAAEGVRAAELGGMGFTVASESMFAPELASGAVRAVLADWTLRRTISGWYSRLAGWRAQRPALSRASWIWNFTNPIPDGNDAYEIGPAVKNQQRRLALIPTAG
jgi:DNA-binding transcriptional LysR family regulator